MLRLRSTFVIVCLVFLSAQLAPAGPATLPADWAFQPVKRPALPTMSDSGWARNPIDQFVLANMAPSGLSPAPEADKLMLIRRVTFDLTGLPPTPQEIRAFAADKSPVAYEKLVDRLLASPHYGEHWGRHWLDVARYVPGRITFLGIKNTVGDQAYRDYVVRAFNNDKPFDGFLTEQLAGDLLPTSNDRQQQIDQIVAPAFLSLGAWFDQCTDPNRLKLEIVDDMINTTGQGMLGLTIACARCHDHKFDPIPTKDYYALAGIFSSTKIVGSFNEYWRDGRQRMLRPLAMPGEVAANDAIIRQADALRQERWKLLSRQHASLLASWQARESDYRAAADKIGHPFIYRWAAENFDGEHNLRIAQLNLDGRSVDVIESMAPGDQWVVYKVKVPEDGAYRLEALYSTDDAVPVNVLVNGANVGKNALAKPTGGWDLIYQQWTTVAECDFRQGINFIRMQTKAGSFPRLDRFRLVKVRDAKPMESDLNAKLLAAFVNDPQQPYPTIAGVLPYLEASDLHAVEEMDRSITSLEHQVKPYQTAITVADVPEPADIPVHLRGDVYSTAPATTPRGVPGLLTGVLASPSIRPGESGRLELAKWIADPRNPLTSRVFVNRVWQWNFGRGIVATPSNFGKLGERPTNPELLDWLASEFVDSGFSVKHIQRLILTSTTYRMSSVESPEAVQIDPDNRTLSHFPRKRLEAESLYDAMASATNVIVRQESGKPLDVEKDKNRAMYVLASNRSPKGLGGEVRKMFDLFDYDSSGVPIAQRPQSVTASQSLFWLNSPLVDYFADRFAARLLKMDKLDDRHRIEMAYLLALGRSPTPAQYDQAIEYLKNCQLDQKLVLQHAWASLCQTLFATVEFRYVN